MKKMEVKERQANEWVFFLTVSCRFLRAAGGYDDWPTGRGIFHTPDKKFLAWVNEEDHMRFISMQKGGDLKEVYLRLVKVSLVDMARLWSGV